MTSAKFSGFLTPSPGSPLVRNRDWLIYRTKSTQPPLVHLLLGHPPSPLSADVINGRPLILMDMGMAQAILAFCWLAASSWPPLPSCSEIWWKLKSQRTERIAISNYNTIMYPERPWSLTILSTPEWWRWKTPPFRFCGYEEETSHISHIIEQLFHFDNIHSHWGSSGPEPVPSG